ncbi:MAG: VIT domain-containing protein [Pseudomonadota bacterium]
MPTASSAVLHDPLRVFLERRAAPHPVPLSGTDFDVVIEGGLAIVTTTRLFRNTEDKPIEATLTFPMPVHATLFDLRVKIAGRELIAKAQSRNKARATYEDAIERGKSAVLHEEVLRGIHMLSVANIPAGAEIEVRTQWVATLTVIAATGHLRIPVTVGDVYGTSPLAGSDDLKVGGAPVTGTLTVHAPGARVRLAGGTLVDGKAKLVLNRPIDLAIDGWRSGLVRGTAADGRAVSLALQPAPAPDASLNIAVLVDHSGSMQDEVSPGRDAASKHDHVVAALRKLAGALSPDDAVDLWEFDSRVRRVGAGKLGRLVDQLSAPAGGTEIGAALAAAIQGSAADSILLITDGKSHALDVQELARMGRPVSVVLVGEDSLEANVGHLAALTGGDIFVSGGADLDGLLAAALDTLRGAGRRTDTETFRRAGMMVTLSHDAAPATGELELISRAVAAASASFLLPTLNEAEAAGLAEREGLVSHLTSLVLVDEAGATQEVLPGQRPVALPAPALAQCLMDFAEPAPALLRRGSRRLSTKLDGPHIARRFALKIDWASDPQRLLAGDLSQLPLTLREDLLAIARKDGLMKAAATLGMPPLLLLIALLAYHAGDRAATRIARRLLPQADDARIEKLALLLED